MGRRDELAARKAARQVVDDLPLPLRVQVQVDLVDQDDRFRLGGRVRQLGVGLGEPPRQVEHQRQGASLTVRELPHSNRGATAIDQQLRALVAADPQVGVARKEPRYRVLEGRKHATGRGPLRLQSLLDSHPGRELPEPKLAIRERIGESRSDPTGGNVFPGARSDGTARLVENSTANGRPPGSPPVTGARSGRRGTSAFSGVSCTCSRGMPAFFSCGSTRLPWLVNQVAMLSTRRSARHTRSSAHRRQPECRQR